MAASGQGYFVAEGEIVLPDSAEIEGAVLGAFLPTVRELGGFEIRAPRARVVVAEQDYLVVDTPPLPEYHHGRDFRMQEWNLTAVTLRLSDAGPSGWFGVYGAAGARISATAVQSLQIAPKDISHIGNAKNPLLGAEAEQRGWGEPANEYYRFTAAEDHFFLSATGPFVITGPSATKLYGPSISISSNEYTGEIQTGQTAATGVPAKAVSRWMIIYLETGESRFETTADTTVLLKDARTSWSGTAELVPVRGHLSTEETSYSAEGRSVFLTGDFSATLTPRREADRLLTSMSVTGNLAGTTLTPQAVSAARAPGAGDGAPWLSLLLFGTVVVAGSAGAAYVVSRRRRAAPVARGTSVAAPASAEAPAFDDDGLQADDCMRFADEAAGERRWARALHWAQRARKLAPQNARVRADEGEYLFQLGLFEEALKALAEASRLDAAEGYADYRGAQAAVSAGRPVDEVLDWLVRALDRSPDLVGDLELFHEFDALRGDPRYDAMVLKAYARLGIDPAPPA